MSHRSEDVSSAFDLSCLVDNMQDMCAVPDAYAYALPWQILLFSVL